MDDANAMQFAGSSEDIIKDVDYVVLSKLNIFLLHKLNKSMQVSKLFVLGDNGEFISNWATLVPAIMQFCKELARIID